MVSRRNLTQLARPEPYPGREGTLVGEAIGFYFRGMNKEEVTAIRAELNRIAKELGYTARTGPTKGQGNAAALLVAIARGEVTIARATGD